MWTPWVHQARVKGLGVDCLGLLGMSALALGLPGAAEWRADPAMHSYGRLPRPEFLYASCERFMDRIDLSLARESDVLVMAFRRFPQHFAMISKPGYVIHAYQSVGFVAENGIAVAGAKVLRAYRFRGVA